MTKRKKRIARLKEAKGEVPFKLLGQVLGDCGYKLTSTRGSHFKFSDKSSEYFVIPVHNKKVKNCYVRAVINKLQL